MVRQWNNQGLDDAGFAAARRLSVFPRLFKQSKYPRQGIKELVE